MSSFFLLGKGPDNDLVLLSTAPLASRKEALAELSRLTADPGFGHWDAEVFVIDLETGTPVLLVRPEVTAPVEKAEVPEPEEAAEPEEEAAEEAAEPEEAPEPADELEEPVLETEAAPEVAAEAAEEPDVDEALAAVIEDLASETAEDASAVEAPEPVVVERAVVDVVEEPGTETEQVDAAYAEAVLETSVEEASTLKAALERTAAQMAASGITPPESVGPVEESAEAAPEESVVAPSEPLTPEAAWPWATDEEGPAFTISALEEPGVDEGSLVRAAGDDETMAVSRPVILGAYEEPSEEPVAPAMEPAAAAEPAAPEAPEAPAAPAPELEVATDVLAAETEPAAEPESDFILDLEQVVSEPAPEPAGYQASDSPREMTCSDCVYVETCPNKDQRDPTSCGSFQWK